MAFSWILGRRFERDLESLEKEVRGAGQLANHEQSQGPIDLADVLLSIEDGVLMVFGPDGDPVPLDLLKESCIGQGSKELRLPDGKAVDHDRLIKVLEAQKRHPLAERRSDGWVEAMLGIAGAFVPTPSELLAGEESSGRRELGGSLTLDFRGGETITICDAHPGDVESGPRAMLRMDDRPVSIDDVLCRRHRDEVPEDMTSMRLVTSEDRLPSIILSLGHDAEVQLEAASDIWTGEPKVNLFLSGGRQTSIDDLAALLQDQPEPDSWPDKELGTCSYPLIGTDEPAFDLERASIVMVTDIPEGWSLTSGMQSEQGAWVLDPSDLMSTSVRVGGAHEGPVTLNLKVISIVGHDGTLVKQSRAIAVPAVERDEDDAWSLPLKEVNEKEPGHAALLSITPLDFETAERRQADDADAVFLKGLPKEMRLTAGIFDPALQGWILKPAELDGLSVQGGEGGVESIEIELRAIYLESDGQSRAEVIIAKTVLVGSGTGAPEKIAAGASR